MGPDVVPLLACPDCRSPLETERVGTWFELHGRYHVDSGALVCSTGHRFPIVGEVPRLVPRARLEPAEMRALAENEGESPREISPVVLSGGEIESRIRKLTETRYGLSSASPVVSRLRAEDAVAYAVAEFRGDNKEKYLRLIDRRVGVLGQVLEVGAGLPGFSRILKKRFEPAVSVVADLDIGCDWSFKTETREVTLVKADCCSLPFGRKAFDLAISAFMLEHVPDWRGAIRSILDVSGNAMIAFGPNRWFPFEIGHLDAPLAGTLPKGLAAHVAWWWLLMTGRRRSMASIKTILEGVHHVSSVTFRRYCLQLGGSVENMFPELVQVVGEDDRAAPTPARRLIKRYPRLTKRMARVLVGCGLEPQMYYFIGMPDAVGLEGPSAVGKVPPT